VVVGGGYGGPTLYFLIQWLLLLAEGTAAARRLSRARPLLGRLGTWVAVLVPLPLVVHGPYVVGFVVPYLRDLGVPGV
jgi:hypothetical protein